MSQILVKEGYAPKGAATGRAGLTVFNRETFELVFLDIRLPDVDGLNVLRQMKEASPETPVIVITAFGSIESAVEAIKLGAFEFLTKPFTPEELRVVARKAMKSRTMMLENILLRRDLRAHGEFDRIVGDSKPMRQVLRPDFASKPDRFAGAHHGRKRNGQGACRAGNPLAQPPPTGPLRRRGLRELDGAAPRGRPLRPC